MPALDRDELSRFLGEHLTAAAVIVPIDTPIDPDQPVSDARDYLAEKGFDVALMGGDRLLVLTKEAAEQAAVSARSPLAGAVAQSPPRDRVIERTLPLRQVTRKLRNGRHPLLVVGGDAITHIITVADFAGVAGTAAVLLALLTLDAKLNALLLCHENQAWQALEPKQQRAAENYKRKAAKQGGELASPLNYLSMFWRLQLVRALGLAEQFDLGTEEEHTLLFETRNATAHVLHEPAQTLRALELAEQLLERVDSALQWSSVEGEERSVAIGPSD